MKPGALGAVLLLAAVPAAALSAQSCPGPDLSVAPAGATAVELRHADVPSARFPGQWQQGRLGDLSYRLYPGGFGAIGEGTHMETWRIEISCDPDNRTCTYRSFGAVPEGMQPRARQLGRCLLGPEPPATPAAPAKESAPPAAEPEAPARQPAPAAPKAATPVSPEPAAPGTPAPEPAPASPQAASRPARETAPVPAAPRTLTREPAPAAPQAAGGPAPAARETAQSSATPGALTRQPAPAVPNAVTPAEARSLTREPAPAPAAREPATPPAEPRPPARRQAAPHPGEPRAFLCWTVPEVGGTGTPESEVLVCRPAPVPPDVSAAPSPARETAAPPPVPPNPAPRSAGPESGPGTARPPADPAGSQGQPGPAPQGPPGGPDDRPAPAKDGADAAPRDDPPPRPRAAAAPPTPDRINLLPLSRPRRVPDRPEAPPSGGTVIARPSALFTPRPAFPPPGGHPRPQPPAAPPLALTRCALGSAMALGREEIGEIGQISVNLGCSGRFGDRLTFSAGLTAYPIRGDRHGGDLAYSYALNWRVTDRVTLTYANYAAALAGGRALAGLGEGRLQLSAPVAKVPLGDRTLACTGFVSLARSAPSNAGVNCGLDVTERLTVRFSALAYPPGTQREGDTDFSYSASYALSDRVTLTYSNYANNRWPWNRSPDQVDLFHGGALGLSYRRDF
ncbi:hypothetical protein GIY56_12360 [Paracoccus sp. YIM 132242]|uniref:Uncharacterized protein n=1 Tax=Paracoccus lichenicola TaxID=2665644 RepID=A0A6L6HRM4_9RHOB|nr:hypothetical protein [Paracoccus lichenicola]MTE01089.1 hypothetical protein [Paracoccus lichenicola]